MSSAISGVVLAAGTSSRFAAKVPKQLLELDGRPLVRWVATAALGSRLTEVVAVLGHQATRVGAALEGLAVKAVENPDYARGQSTSVRAGLAAVTPRARAALFVPADQPLLSSRLIDRLIDAYHDAARRGREAPIVVPAHRGRRGAPVLFDRSYFAELAALEGDAGGRRLLPRHRSRILEVEVADALELEDTDTAADLARLKGLLAARP